MAPWRRVACLLALAVLVSEAVHVCAKPKPKPPPKPKSPDAKSPSPIPKPSPSPKPNCVPAFAQLVEYNTDSGPFANWFYSVVHSNTTDWLLAFYNKVQSQAGPNDNKPVLILPSNAAFNSFLKENNLPNDAKRWNSTATAKFKLATAMLVVPWRTAKNHWPKYFVNCTLLGLTQDMSNPLTGMNLQLWNGKGPGLTAALRVQHQVPSKGRRLAKSATTTNYGVVGQGYNTLVGFPISSASGGGVDPGFTGYNMFQMYGTSQQPVVTPIEILPPGLCSTAWNESTYSTPGQLYSAASASLGPDGNYGGASFSQNQDYVVLASQMNNTQESYVILSTTNSLGGYSIDAAAPVLDPNYAEAVQNLCSAYTQGTDAFNSIMSSFAAAYGSSFVKYFYYGGYAASTLQMSSSGYIYFQSQNISLTEGATETFILSGADVSGYDGNLDAGLEVESDCSMYGYVQIPSSTVMPFTSSGEINCPTWTENLQTAVDYGILTPVLYQIGSQSAFLSGANFYLFGEPCDEDVLQGVAAGMVEYFETCGTSEVSCPPTNSCPNLSFAYESTCVYCYDQAWPGVSPMCAPGNTASCSLGSCTCKNGYSAASLCYSS